MCPWMTPTDEDDELECGDGSACNSRSSPKGWSCCTEEREKRRKCPRNLPVMCADKTCGYEGTDYCCNTEIGCTEEYGGPRECDETRKHIVNFYCIWDSYTYII